MQGWSLLRNRPSGGAVSWWAGHEGGLLVGGGSRRGGALGGGGQGPTVSQRQLWRDGPEGAEPAGGATLPDHLCESSPAGRAQLAPRHPAPCHQHVFRPSGRGFRLPHPQPALRRLLHQRQRELQCSASGRGEGGLPLRPGPPRHLPAPPLASAQPCHFRQHPTEQDIGPVVSLLDASREDRRCHLGPNERCLAFSSLGSAMGGGVEARAFFLWRGRSWRVLVGSDPSW